jgi:phosphotransacetylase
MVDPQRRAHARLIDAVSALRPAPTAVAHPCDACSLSGAIDAARMTVIAPVLVGPRRKIETAARDAGLDISAYGIVDAAHGHDAAAGAVVLMREGRVGMLMKGSHLEAGDMLAKNLGFLKNADSAGIAPGGRAPITLTSRADSVQSRLASCAASALVAHRRKTAAPLG